MIWKVLLSKFCWDAVERSCCTDTVVFAANDITDLIEKARLSFVLVVDDCRFGLM